MRIQLLIGLCQLYSAVSLHVPELSGWQENVYVDCIFCVDYDSYRRLNFSGCQKGKSTICKGNTCYMRQHKNSQFFLFTSGCLNLTKAEHDEIGRGQLAAERHAGGTGTETLLCEVATKTNTCMCRGVNGQLCNNMSLPAQFTEFHTNSLFGGLRFHELLQFRFYMPHTPIFQSVDLRLLDEQLLQSVRGFRFTLSSVSPLSTIFTVFFALALNL